MMVDDWGWRRGGVSSIIPLVVNKIIRQMPSQGMSVCVKEKLECQGSGVTEDFHSPLLHGNEPFDFYLSADLSSDPGNLVQSFVFSVHCVKCGKMVEN